MAVLEAGRGMAVGATIRPGTQFGRLDAATWWSHYRATGAHLHVTLGGEDVTTLVRAADDAEGWVEWAKSGEREGGEVEIRAGGELFASGSLLDGKAAPQPASGYPTAYHDGRIVFSAGGSNRAVLHALMTTGEY